MQGRSPGLWIAAAIILAVLVVAISVPRRSPAPPQPPVANRETETSPLAPKPDPKSATSARSGETRVPSPPPASSAATAGDAPVVVAPKVAPRIATPIVETPLPVPALPGREEPAPSAIPRSTVVEALDNVHFTLRDYRAALGGNPEGTNAEITSALLGRNLKQVRMDLPQGSRVSATGELCDPWGTPYFFHQLSAQKMEIRSAGPDLKMWTGDDIEM